jgi:hypothetical protein
MSAFDPLQTLDHRFRMADMAASKTANSARNWGRASIVNSLLLLPAAALQLDVTFWVLGVTNFALMHAIWLDQLVRRKEWAAVDFGLVKWPLIAFAVLGNGALLLWDERLFGVFPA